MLSQLQLLYEPGRSYDSYAPHVMTADANLSKIVSLDTIDQTDATFYLITAWGRYVQLTADTQMERDYYALLSKYATHYLAPNASSLGSGGSPSHPQKGGGVPYFNQSLSLLWNANLEHSRLGSYWSAYDALTNSFAAEGLRVLAQAATRLGLQHEAQHWEMLRGHIMRGINTSLSTTDELGNSVYAELRGHPNDFSEDKQQVGYSPLLRGISYENIVPLVLGISGIHAGDADVSVGVADPMHGLDTQRLDNTWALYRRLGSFQWVNQDPELSAFVLTTHVNVSAFVNPPVTAGVTPDWCAYTGQWNVAPSCPAYDGQSCACASFAVIGLSLIHI